MRSGFDLFCEPELVAETILALNPNTGKIDLVFTDVRMPGTVDGFVLCGWVRQHCPTIPVFLASGDIGNAHSQDELAPGQLFFSKPYSLEAVVSRIKIELSSRAQAI